MVSTILEKYRYAGTEQQALLNLPGENKNGFSEKVASELDLTGWDSYSALPRYKSTP